MKTIFRAGCFNSCKISFISSSSTRHYIIRTIRRYWICILLISCSVTFFTHNILRNEYTIYIRSVCLSKGIEWNISFFLYKTDINTRSITCKSKSVYCIYLIIHFWNTDEYIIILIFKVSKVIIIRIVSSV